MLKEFSLTDLDAMERRYRANFINSLLGFKYVNLIGTKSNAGISNLALFNSVFHLGANPPLLGMVVRPPREENDTLKNIRETGEYTINNVLPQWYEQAHQASAAYPSGYSEFNDCDFDEWYLPGFSAPFVGQATIKLGMKVREFHPMLNQTTIVVGEIVHILLDDEWVGADGYIDQMAAGTIAVAGLDAYFRAKPLGRLPYAKAGKP